MLTNAIPTKRVAAAAFPPFPRLPCQAAVDQICALIAVGTTPRPTLGLRNRLNLK